MRVRARAEGGQEALQGGAGAEGGREARWKGSEGLGEVTAAASAIIPSKRAAPGRKAPPPNKLS